MTQEQTPPPYQLSHLIIEGTLILAYAALMVFFGLRLDETFFQSSWILFLLFGAMGLIAADITSGLVHWAADTWGSFRTPFFGPWLIRSFREHHVDPASITRHGFIETNGANSVGGTILMIPAHLFMTISPLISSFFVTYGIGIAMTNQVHKWSHLANPPRWIQFLQRRGLMLSPSHHSGHHSGKFDRHYCITLGVMNKPLDRISFFRYLEEKISDWTGAVPRA